MSEKSTTKVSVVVPNWNGISLLKPCLDSLLAQTLTTQIIVVENGSKDGSLEFLQTKYPSVKLVVNKRNKGFAGGVNGGIRLAVKNHADYIALFNNDAVADKDWIKQLVGYIERNPDTGIVTSKLIDSTKNCLDSTGEMYSVWGLPFPRGRGEPIGSRHDDPASNEVFGGSGGASLYRVKMFKQIGLFDKDFFAYYEDVDLSFRAQLAGWKIRYCPKAIAYHQIGTTSGKINGFTTYQTMKNLPWLLWKNVPAKYLPTVLPRFSLAYFSFFAGALRRYRGWSATKGMLVSVGLLPKKLWQRRKIQTNKKIPDSYIWNIMVHDLPPNAHKLRILRSRWWKMGRRA
jgi:GT2 family glycosyltransferase